MLSFQDFDTLKEWSERQDEAAILLIAARATLRVFPLLNQLQEFQSELDHPIPQLILPVLWSSATAILAYVWIGNRETDFDLTSNTDVIYSFGFNHDIAELIAEIGAGNTAEVGFAASSIFSIDYSLESTFAALADDFTAHSMNMDALQADVDFIDNGGTAQGLSEKPLWHDADMPSDLSDHWQSLRLYLKEQDQDWQVWTDWYQDRLDGGVPLIEAIEIGEPDKDDYGRISFPKEYYQDPARLNAALKDKIFKYHAEQAEQDNTAEIFDWNGDDKIDVVTVQTGAGLHITPEQGEWYAALRNAVEEALEAGQQLGTAQKPLKSLYAALPDDMAQARVARLWPRANKIRRLIRKHQRALASNEPNINRLDDDAADDCEAIVGAYNNLRMGDANLLTKDEHAISPRDVPELQALSQKIQPIIEKAIAQNLTTPEARQVLEDAQQDISEIDIQNDIMGRAQLEQSIKTQKNFIIMLVKSMRDISAIKAGVEAISWLFNFLSENGPVIWDAFTSFCRN